METTHVNNSVRMLRLPDVLKRTALSRSQIYRLIEQNDFPKQVRLGERAAGWVEEEVESWLRERIERSRAHAAASTRLMRSCSKSGGVAVFPNNDSQ
jgi:prophage regulatory protein